MYDYGSQILNEGTRMPEFCSYLGVLVEYVPRMSDVNTAEFTAAMKGRKASDFDKKLVGRDGGSPEFGGTNWSNNTYPYHEQDDISFERMRTAYDVLRDGAANNDQHAQRLLLKEMQSLDEYARGSTADTAWRDYRENLDRMRGDLDRLRKSADLVQKAANDIAGELMRKRDECNVRIARPIDEAARNRNVAEFELRLRTGAEAISNRNEGGWHTGGRNSWAYLHHGDPGNMFRDYNNWEDVRLDIEQKVIRPFAVAIASIDSECMEVHINIQTYSAVLAEALNVNAPGGPI